MSLQYGYDFPKQQFENVIKKDDKLLEFYHKKLPFILMRVDVGEVREDTIDIINERLRATAPIYHFELCDEYRDEANGVTGFASFLRKHFIGFQANVTTLSREGYAKKMAHLILNNTPEVPEEITKRWSNGGNYDESWQDHTVTIKEKK